MSALPWRNRIALAKQRGEFNKFDRRDCSSWKTCGVGEQDPRIKRDEVNEPYDKTLFDRGIDFSVAVHDNNFAGAQTALDAIGTRSRELLQMYDTGEPTGEAPRVRETLD